MADSERHGHLMSIIDQLDVKTLSVEAVSLLASMADSIRSALEKGQYLEQLILNQKNKAITNSCKAVELSESQSNHCQEQMNSNLQVTNKDIDCERASSRKKKKKKKNKSPVFQDKDDSSSQVHEASSLDENSFQTESHIELNPVSNVHLSDNFSNASGSSSNAAEEARPLIQLVKLSQLQEEKNTQEESSDLVNVYISRDFFKIKQETADSSVTNFPSKPFVWDPILDESSESSHENEKSPSHHEDQLLMPTPIFIKTELKCPATEKTSPKLILNISESNMDKRPLEPTSDFILNTSRSNENEGCSYSKDTGQSALHSDLETYDQINENKIYFTTGAGVTDSQIKDIFKDLSIVSCNIIHKNTHTFGFIRFSNENDMKVALSLNCKFVFDERELFVRPCYEERNRNPPIHSHKDLPFNKLKRPCSSMQDSAVKRQKISSAPNDSSTGYPKGSPRSSNENSQFPRNQNLGNTSDSNVFHHEERWSGKSRLNDRSEKNNLSSQFRRGRGRCNNFRRGNRGHMIPRRSHGSRPPYNRDNT